MVFLLKWQAIIAIVSSHCTQERLAYYMSPTVCTGLLKVHFWRSWSWTVLWRPTRPSRTNSQKGCPLHYKGLECKSRKSRAIWSNSKFGLGVQNEAGHRLTEFSQQNTLVTANTLSQQHKRRLYTWTSPDGQHWNQIDYVLYSQRWRSSIQSAKTRPGADCGSDHELLIDKFKLKLKKVEKITNHSDMT